MASKNGTFLSPAKREMLLNELQDAGEVQLAAAPSSSQQRKRTTTATSSNNNNKRKRSTSGADVQDSKPSAGTASFGTGCLTCGTDDDHANLMLCEGCNDEYHTYCLEPPLRSVPTGDWFCDNCKPIYDVLEEDGLDQQICALPPSFTSRFGEICWAQGGVGFGWWPACIYDPRLTVGNARQLARKNLGKRHLVYFFECHGAPFSVLNNAKLTKWEDGLIEDYHLGRAAKTVGKARSHQFSQALQAAIIEHGKPIEQRLEWNHMSDTAQLLPSPKKIAAPSKTVTEDSKKRHRSSNGDKRPTIEDTSSSSENGIPKRSVGFAFLPSSVSASVSPGTALSRRNLEQAIQALGSPTNAVIPMHAVNPIEMNEDGELYCSVLKRKSGVTSTNDIDGEIVEAIGFVRLASRKTSTFADARDGITNDLDQDYIPASWKFYVPVLGPVSRKQESSLGPVLPFLQQTTTDARIGDGTIRRPLKLVIMEEAIKNQG